MQYIRYNKKRGYVALMSVIVLGGIGVSVAVSLLLLGLQTSRASFTAQQSAQARALADACAEEALQEIRDDDTYTGTDSLTLSTGSCSYTVTDTGGDTRFIVAEGQVDTTVRRAEVTVDGLSPSITLSDWQEVADF